MDNKRCLTAIEMSALSTVFIECFESELLKQTPKQRLLIESFVLSFSINTKLHMLFTHNGLKSITENTFNNTDFRDFILCLTDQFNCITAVSDLDDRSVMFSIGYGLDASKVLEDDNQFNLIPKRVNENMERSGELIISILENNKWLLTLVLIYLFFQKTHLFNSFSQNINSADTK